MMASRARPPSRYHQAPIAVVGMACRLPGSCNDLKTFWDFLENGGVAPCIPPKTRFSHETHDDGSKKRHTMASPGGMFIDADPRDLDASFFRLPKSEAIAMDPQQRQLLEVVYEGLENSGVTMEELSGQNIACFVGSYACDYGDLESRDPEDRPHFTTVGTGRAMLSNRISHFLNIKGPSMTIDTACSGSLIGIDLANRYLQTGEIDGAIVAGCNIYLSPEHVMDGLSTSGTASLSGKCHTFDAKADGYIKAEAVNMVMLKRLDDALQDGNPIRGIILGTATGSDGWTPGIASPNSVAQAATIRQAYANANIDDLSATSYIECHGTGTKAGDRIELDGVASVFSSVKSEDNPLAIGSVKSNIGHSEPAAGISGLLKVLLSIEKGIIPGNPTFETPNPDIDFQSLRVRASKAAIGWSVPPEKRRAGVNSFGFGGSNAHIVVESDKGLSPHISSYSSTLFPEEKTYERPYILAFSANDEVSLTGAVNALDRHLAFPGVNVDIRDLAYTLSEKRTRHFHKGFTIAWDASVASGEMIQGKTMQRPRIGLVFTGQGAQWPQMGRDLVSAFPVAKQQILHLEKVLKTLPDGPPWSLLEELILPRKAEHFRNPELSQTLVAALQLAILAVLEDCNVEYQATIGHSSGEIVAATAAGLLTPEDAIKIAYYRGKSVTRFLPEAPLGMMAVGLGREQVLGYLERKSTQIACVNSPESITLSGILTELLQLEEEIKRDGHFVRLLQIDTAYHSQHMTDAAIEYRNLMEANCGCLDATAYKAKMYSSVSTEVLEDLGGASYWEINMISTVQFDGALREMLQEPLDILLEIGPSNALSGPINQIKKSLGSTVEYISTWKRDGQPLLALCGVAGKLFIRGAQIDLFRFNSDSSGYVPSVIVDLPNYQWNHSTKYWHESRASKDWRFRKFPHHDLLGSKVLGTLWQHPTWRKMLRIQDVPWLRDHRLGETIVFPAAGYVAMAMEAAFQMQKAVGRVPRSSEVDRLTYNFRNCRFLKALVLEDDGIDQEVLLTLTPKVGLEEGWLAFTISSSVDELLNIHSTGLVRADSDTRATHKKASDDDVKALLNAISPDLWYKAMKEVGYNFGPSFQRLLRVESVVGSRQSRSILSFENPSSSWRESSYPMHPTSIDACFQAVAGSIWAGDRTAVNARLVPKMIDKLVVHAQWPKVKTALAVATSNWTGLGRVENAESYTSDVSAFDRETNNLIYDMQGLQYRSLQADGLDAKPHVYNLSSWQPDISTLSQEQFDLVLGGSADGDRKLDVLLDLIAFKDPEVTVLEVIPLGSGESIWVNDNDRSPLIDRAACSHVQLVVFSQADLAWARGKYHELPNVSTHLMENIIHSLGGKTFDVLLTRDITPSIIDDFLQSIDRPSFLIATMTTTFPRPSGPTAPNEPSPVSPHIPHKKPGCGLISRVEEAGFSQVLHCADASLEILFAAAGKGTEEAEAAARANEIDVLRFSDEFCTEIDNLTSAVSEHGWKSYCHHILTSKVNAGQTVMVLDDLFATNLSNISQDGAQKCVSDPDRSLIHGFSRSIRNENPNAIIFTLDVESGSGCNTASAICKVLGLLSQKTDLRHVDTEFVERGGIFYVERIIPDKRINDFEMSSNKIDSRSLLLFDNRSCVRFTSSQVGSLDHLGYAEVYSNEVPIPDGCVEVDVKAVSLNFKDFAVVMGLVPGYECLLGLDGAGVIRAVGKKTGSYYVGQRVLANKKGSLANRVRCSVDGEVFPIPDEISFEEASTLNTVYSTALYALKDLSSAKKGQSVLIHSAAGGLGLAAVQISKYLGLEIYATVGNEEKRVFLIKEYGLKPERIFSSRTSSFAASAMAATGQRGLDIILNTLAGELLDASWQCIAEGGTFIELGKKDILDRSSISMDPFNRNASFRAADLSRESITPALKRRLLTEIYELRHKGHIKPVVSKTYGFDDIPTALKQLGTGKSIGKIVISRQDCDVLVPIRLIAPELRFDPDGSYLVVGGLKGICGSMAVYLARQGVSSLIILSRSGYYDEISLKISADIKSLGTELTLVVGDVTKIEDIDRVFESTRKPIRGILQGAMVLRDKVYSSMTHEEFHSTILPKTKGSWNLHHAALKRGVELEFFTLLSSICGVVGQKGQANYSAANSFLDAFAAYRRSLNMPACAIDLGVVEDVGYVNSREMLSRRLLAQGWPPINEQLLHRMLYLSILQQRTPPVNAISQAQLITGIPVPLPAESPAHRDVRFAMLRRARSEASRAADANTDFTIRNALKSPSTFSGSREELQAILIDLASQRFKLSLGLSEGLDPERPLASYGIDSLVAIEFRNWAKIDLGVEISTLDVVGARTLASLCGTIIKSGAADRRT
ncbi:hypothetical protein EKO27_g10072 [Xylaria grammica]|uniref:Uncharacterized protein n=1 Tax=Xylaria grammica TaxID=363999 RepID=A0A439CS74_9PEZI|nr:hypothetical protein EKO27_g10072 [Xylaria grammica]